MAREMTPLRRPSIKDVAALAGVSAQTVSRVNNARPNVDPDTRARVLRAMEALGYRRNSAGRSLVTGRFGTIGVITSTLGVYGTQRTIEAVADALDPSAYTLSLLPLRGPSSRDVSGAASKLLEQNVDGLIVIVDTYIIEEMSSLFPEALPLVVTDAGPSMRYRSIDSDPVPGIDAAMAHLAQLGHRRVTHVAGPVTSAAARARRDTWLAYAGEHGLEVSRLLYGDWSAESGYTIGRFLGQDDIATAIFAGNDQMALGVIRALHDLGKRVPQDVSVLGFDDMFEVAFTTPRLTTIRQDFPEIGRRAVSTLLGQIDGRAPGREQELVPTSLIIRDSTGPASDG